MISWKAERWAFGQYQKWLPNAMDGRGYLNSYATPGPNTTVRAPGSPAGGRCSPVTTRRAPSKLMYGTAENGSGWCFNTSMAPRPCRFVIGLRVGAVKEPYRSSPETLRISTFVLCGQAAGGSWQVKCAPVSSVVTGTLAQCRPSQRIPT